MGDENTVKAMLVSLLLWSVSGADGTQIGQGWLSTIWRRHARADSSVRVPTDEGAPHPPGPPPQHDRVMGIRKITI